MLPDMSDPAPENVTGEKRVVHSVEHSIPWGHVALGVGLLALAYVLHAHLTDDGDAVEPVEEPDDLDLSDVAGQAGDAAAGLVN